MRYKQIAETPLTYALIFETGDEIASGLKNFAKEHGLNDSSFKAIGALSSVKAGWLNWETRKYQTSADLNEQVELLSLIGDVAVMDNEPQVHAHISVARKDGTVFGGHLLQATVRPTCELILTESPAALKKEMDPNAGIPLIKV